MKARVDGIFGEDGRVRAHLMSDKTKGAVGSRMVELGKMCCWEHTPNSFTCPRVHVMKPHFERCIAVLQ